MRFLELDRFDYQKVEVLPEIVDAVCEFGKDAHPREFIMFLEGRVSGNVLRITGLKYQEYFSNEDSAMPYIRLPIHSDVVGSVHSHPGPSNRPSRADLHFFSKQGLVHMIIKRPYQPADIQAYTSGGNPISFEMAPNSKK